jgi:hypothetical protein
MSRPVSWLVVERGWAVHAADGKQVGRVEEVVGAPEEDIFSGVVVATGLFSQRFVPDDRVRAISEGRVDLDVSAREVDRLRDRPPTAH